MKILLADPFRDEDSLLEIGPGLALAGCKDAAADLDHFVNLGFGILLRIAGCIESRLRCCERARDEPRRTAATRDVRLGLVGERLFLRRDPSIEERPVRGPGLDANQRGSPDPGDLTGHEIIFAVEILPDRSHGGERGRDFGPDGRCGDAPQLALGEQTVPGQ